MFTKTCPGCGITFSARNRKAKYCSRACSAPFAAAAAAAVVSKGGPPAFTCAVCGQEFRRFVAKGSPTPVYCSRACMTVAYRDRLSADGDPAWRGGDWPYKGRRWKDIAASIVERDRVCADCGSGDNLVVHHLVPQRFWLVLDEANRPDNLMTLCHDCHVRRPEHYWIEVPDGVFNLDLHSRTPMPRTTTKLVAKPPCEVCGKPVRWQRNRFCSHSCANRERWQRGLYRDAFAAHNAAEHAASVAQNSRVCPQCGKTFVRWYGIYCSRACFLAAPTGAPGKGKKLAADV